MKERKILQKRHLKIITGIKCFIAIWVLSNGSFSVLTSGYIMDVPVMKYWFTLLSAMDSWGIETVFIAVGIGSIFYLVRNRQKSPYVTAISAFFAVCTVFGISYAKTDSWDCIFLYNLQFVLALVVMLGYYFLYKNCILFVGYIFECKKEWLRREPSNKLEKLLFDKHSFIGPFILIMILDLPWLISFFPGTLQWDAHAQLWMFFGAVEKTGHHPVAVTEIMGNCIRLGRTLFHSDSIGLFIYTFSQFTLQGLVLSYAFYVMRRFNTPIILRWGAVFIWAIYPFFPMWGYTMVKDTLYYIFIMLLIIVMMDMIYQEVSKIKWWQWLLLLISVIGVSISRNDGRYVVAITMLWAMVLYRKYWKVYISGVVAAALVVIAIEGVYMPVKDIADGPKGEMLSIPLQQTARYLKEHYDELTEEETSVLQAGFDVGLEQISKEYYTRTSDPVKQYFIKYPNEEYLKEYFKVWMQQFFKHPDTYIQAFLNHIYGYFYPNIPDYGNYTATFYIGNSKHWKDGYLDIQFAVEDDSVRKILEQSLHLIKKMPVLGMFLSAGTHTYILLGECVYLFAKKKRRELIILIPQLCVLMICLASPVNAYLRYMMPIMIALPMNLVWCYGVCHKDEEVEERKCAESYAEE